MNIGGGVIVRAGQIAALEEFGIGVHVHLLDGRSLRAMGVSLASVEVALMPTLGDSSATAAPGPSAERSIDSECN